jgi:hypothetical protein
LESWWRISHLTWFIFVKPLYNVQKQLKCNVIQREFSILYLKVSIDQFCRKQFTKLANLLMHSQCALSEPISSSRKTRKLTVCRFI